MAHANPATPIAPPDYRKEVIAMVDRSSSGYAGAAAGVSGGRPSSSQLAQTQKAAKVAGPIGKAARDALKQAGKK